MKVRLKKDHLQSKKGDTVDVPDRIAQYLVTMNVAEYIDCKEDIESIVKHLEENKPKRKSDNKQRIK